MSGATVFSAIYFPSRSSRTISLRPRAVAVAEAATSRTRAAPASLYQVLRVTETATAREIKAAYRAMAKRCHPDAAPTGTAAEFLEIRRAYDTLSDPAARAQYDRSIAESRAGQSRYADRIRFRRWETDQCW